MIKIRVPIYNKNIYIYLEGEEKLAISKMNRLYGINDERVNRLTNSAGLCVGNILYIGDISINTLAHELSHVIDGLIANVEVKDEEAKAYLVGYIFEQVCKKLDIIWKKNKNVNKL